MVDDKLAKMKEFWDKVVLYKRPEQLFGDLGAGTKDQMLERLKKNYSMLLFLYFPDQHNGESKDLLEVAGDISSVIIYLYSLAKKKVEEGTYGSDNAASNDEPLFPPIKTRNHRYEIMRVLASGNLATVYSARMDGAKIENVCLKVADNPADNHRLLREMESLTNVPHKQIPFFIEAFETADERQALAMQLIDGLDLVALRDLSRYKKGIPQEHVAWIMERSLSVLGYFHKQGRLHGNIIPEHLVVRSRDHKVFLIDFTESVKGRSGKYTFAADIFGAPEISSDSDPNTKTDLFSFGKCMIFALGGDPATNRVPTSVHPKIIDFLGDLVNRDPERREKNAWGAARRLSDLREEIFCKRHDFSFFATD